MRNSVDWPGALGERFAEPRASVIPVADDNALNIGGAYEMGNSVGD